MPPNSILVFLSTIAFLIVWISWIALMPRDPVPPCWRIAGVFDLAGDCSRLNPKGLPK